MRRLNLWNLYYSCESGGEIMFISRQKWIKTRFLCIIFIFFLSCLVTFPTPFLIPSEWGTMSQWLKGIQSLSERHSVTEWIRFTQRVGGRTAGKEDIYSLFVSIITNRWNIQWIIIYLITCQKNTIPLPQFWPWYSFSKRNIQIHAESVFLHQTAAWIDLFPPGGA